LDRTYPSHIKFRGLEGKQSLYRVLRAYAVKDPEVSYTQGMSFIVAMFLIFLSEEESF
jgi:GTPase-activating protein